MAEPGTRPAVGGCEVFHSTTRLVVAPATGSFEPAMVLSKLPEPVSVTAGQVVGHISSTAGKVEVTSPFSGDVDSVVAWPNERLQRHQRLLSLRLAS